MICNIIYNHRFIYDKFTVSILQKSETGRDYPFIILFLRWTLQYSSSFAYQVITGFAPFSNMLTNIFAEMPPKISSSHAVHQTVLFNSSNFVYCFSPFTSFLVALFGWKLLIFLRNKFLLPTVSHSIKIKSSLISQQHHCHLAPNLVI